MYMEREKERERSISIKLFTLPSLEFSFFIFQKGPQWKRSFLAFLHERTHDNNYRLYFHFNCSKSFVGKIDLPTYLPTLKQALN